MAEPSLASGAIRIVNATLPFPRFDSTAVTFEAPSADASGIYVFGGLKPDCWCSTDQIVRFDPQTEEWRVMRSTVDGWSIAAVSDGTAIFLFGGYRSHPSGASVSNASYRYDPATDNLTRLDDLPSPRSGAVAVWTGTSIYIIGGGVGVGGNDHAWQQILRFNPENGNLTVTNSSLPASASQQVSGFWDGRLIHIFVAGNSFAYNPLADHLEEGKATPIGLSDTGMAWNGHNGYFFGGNSQSASYSNRIVRYNLSAESFEPMTAHLPSPIVAVASAPHDESFFIFGGSSPKKLGDAQAGLSYSDRTVRYDPAKDTVDVLPQTKPTGATRDASSVLLSIQDFPAGWTLADDEARANNAPGFGNGWHREFYWSSQTGFSNVLLIDEALVFDVGNDAGCFFSAQVASVQADHSIEKRRVGDDAIYWQDGGDANELILKGTAVWKVERLIQGYLSGGMTLDDAAQKSVGKYG